jgi:2-polyprenyl-6-methoxyphenol hydroxylase-like FAD-dependent oxidoreductase
MSRLSPRVVIIGAGLGGLCLAQGLRKAGIDVAVYERDPTASARAQGYRISVDVRGTSALRECLPSALYALFEATCGQPSTGGSTFATEGPTLKELHTFRFPQGPTAGLAMVGRAVDRLTLRETLLAGLDDAVQFGKEFTRYELLPGSAVRAHFADGTEVSGDLLVAADGVGSRVRQQHLPEATLIDTGIRWLGGRTLLDSGLRGLLPAALSDRALWVNDRGIQVFLASVLFQQAPDQVAAVLWPGLRFTDNEDFLMWALVGQKDQLVRSDRELAAASEPQLHRLAVEATAGGHHLIKAIVEAATPDRSFFLSIRTVRQVGRWQSSRVTYLGDAIHAGPVNGTGANSALQDAALLCWHLAAEGGKREGLDHAIRNYEVEMLERVRATLAGMRAAQTNAWGVQRSCARRQALGVSPTDVN